MLAASACIGLALTALTPARVALAEASAEGFHGTPSVGWSRGDNRLDLFLDFRFRWENWDARATQHSNFYGLRTRFGAIYSWRDRVRVHAEAQQTTVLDVGPQSSGPGLAYFNVSGGNTDPNSIHVRQLFVEVSPTENTGVKVGRQTLRMGTWVDYTGEEWRYIKKRRMGERLVGIVGWTNGTRAFDGIRGDIERAGHHVTGFAAQPTRGVLDVDGAFKWLEDVYVGGVEWTAPPGTLSEKLDFTAFFVGYGDDRINTAINNDTAIYTLGGSLAGLFDLGPGKVDAFVWGAFQAGHFREGAGNPTLDHLAGALLAEVGYRLPDVYGQPWVRTGVNFGSGDGNPADGEHRTFFNLLPTNHGYYGLVDQLALQNLVDWFTEVQFKPIGKLSLSFFVHGFWLADSMDRRYFGSGAFTPNSLAYGSSPSQGSNNVGWETDIVLHYAVHRTTTLMVGYGQLFGGGVFGGTPNNGDTQWGFAQIQFAY